MKHETDSFLESLDPEIKQTWEEILERAILAAQAATGLSREEVEGVALREAMTEFARVAEYRDGKWIEKEFRKAA
jgi:hypothetical protein